MTATKFQHPTGKAPKSIHLVCCGITIRDYLAANMGYDVTLPAADEVWSLNKALRTIRSDFGFILDDLVGEYVKSERYAYDVCQLSKMMPIMTTTVDQPVKEQTDARGGNISNLFEYPITQIRDAIGAQFWESTKREMPNGMTVREAIRQKGNNLLYFKNSVPMILAYAWFIGVESMVIFGADYTHPAGQRREDDQPNCEYWLGWCEGQGMQIYLPGDTTLKKTRDGKDLYGYGARQPKL